MKSQVRGLSGARVLVTGMSGTGKSSALSELARRGFRVVDTDYGGWSEWSEDAGGWVWREDRIARLLRSLSGETLYVSGCVSNQGKFYDRFDAVVLLSAPLDVIEARIRSRTTNQYGKRAGECELVRADFHTVEPRLRATSTLEIDATRPLDEVVEALIGVAGEASRPDA